MQHHSYNDFPSTLHQRHHNHSRSSGWNQREQHPPGHLEMEPFIVDTSEYAMRGNHYSNNGDGHQEAYSSHLNPSRHQLSRGHSHHSTRGRHHEDLTHGIPGSYPTHPVYDREAYNPRSTRKQVHTPYPVEPQRSLPNAVFPERQPSFRSRSPILDEMSMPNRPVTPSRSYSMGRQQSHRSGYHSQQPSGYVPSQSYHPTAGMSYSRSSSPRESDFYYSSQGGSYDDPYIEQPVYNGNYYTNPHYYGHPATYNTAMYPTSGAAGAYPTVVPLNGGAGGYVVLPTAEGQDIQVIDASGKTSRFYAPGYSYHGDSFFSRLFSPSTWGFGRRKSSRRSTRSSRRSSRSRRGSFWSFLDDL